MDAQTAAVIISGVAAILAWVAKLRWSREYAAAKDEIVRSKDAQIEVLRQQLAGLQELTSMKIREYFLSTKAQLEEYIDRLQAQLAETDVKLTRVSAELEATRSSAQAQVAAAQVQALDAERRALSTYLTHLRNRLVHASGAAKSLDDPAFRTAISSLFQALKAAGRSSATVAEDDDGTISVDWADPRVEPPTI